MTNTMPHLDDEITNKKTQEKFNLCENHLFYIKRREKKSVEGVILGQ
jgi:hypothetical protein